ncbi:MAG: appA 2 [Candidatus Krumholzibacteriota bacterium]|nr:appA 2 [Candidatus Krumholzibacteriota bacterium]
MSALRFTVWRSARRLAAALAFVALLAGCGPGGDRGENEGGTGAGQAPGADALGAATGAPVKGGRVTIGVQEEPERLSEILNATAVNNLICGLVFSKFVKYDDQLRLVPDLIEEIPTAENGGISPDHLTYTYRLKRNARWHDGAPVTSADVAFTYRVIMDPAVNVESREGWDAVSSVETPDDRTVVFRLSRAFPDFVSEIFFDESVLPEHILGGETGEAFQRSAFHHEPVGSGPFRFKEWKSGSHISLARSDGYYGEGPYLDEIVFKFVPDENALLIQMETGEIDVFDNAGASFLPRLKTIPGVAVHLTPTMMYEHIDLNTEDEILADRRVRQAIAFATDRKAIADLVYEGLAEPALLDEYPSSKYYDAQAAGAVRYDPLRARMLLRDAGWIDEDGDGVLEKDGRDLALTISATAGRLSRERTETVLRDQYREVGIDLKVKNHNPTVFAGSYEEGGILKTGAFDLALYAWLSSPEPATKEDLYSIRTIPPAGQNHPRIRNERLTALLEQGARETDEKRRVEVYHEIARILVEEAPVIPLFWYTAIDARAERLMNFKPNPTQSSDTWNANTWYLAPQAR